MNPPTGFRRHLARAARLAAGWSGLADPGTTTHARLANNECCLADARGWPMLALYSEKTVPASVAGIIVTPSPCHPFTDRGRAGEDLMRLWQP